jgi:hypothetical protein
MGILREEDKKQIRIENLNVAPITYADYVFDDSTDDELVIVDVEVSEEDDSPTVNPIHKLDYERRLSRRNAKYEARKALNQTRKQMMASDVVDFNVKKRMGAHKWRRIENARILAQFADANDIRFDCSDLVEETMSAFTRLMQDAETMRAWNEFIEKDEVEQEKFLHELDNVILHESRKANVVDADEKRAHHPGYSAKTCFQRLDKEFKKALSKKSGVRMELIEKLETEFRKFFNDNPNGVWSDSVNSNQKRFYLHAVAQFLMLQSRSEQSETQGTITEVHNPRKTFEPPRESLHSYLHKKHNRKNSKGDDEW